MATTTTGKEKGGYASPSIHATLAVIALIVLAVMYYW